MVKKNKKAMLYQEWMTYVMAIIMVSVAIFFTSKGITGANTNINEMAPELTYQFPAVFIHTFLNYKIEKDDVISLNLDSTKEYKVKDLILLDTANTRNKVEAYRTKYLDEINKIPGNNNKPTDYFQEYSQKKIDESSLLLIKTDVSQLPDLESEINNKNYFFYMKTIGGKYTLIYFTN